MEKKNLLITILIIIILILLSFIGLILLSDDKTKDKPNKNTETTTTTSKYGTQICTGNYEEYKYSIYAYSEKYYFVLTNKDNEEVYYDQTSYSICSSDFKIEEIKEENNYKYYLLSGKFIKNDTPINLAIVYSYEGTYNTIYDFSYAANKTWKDNKKYTNYLIKDGYVYYVYNDSVKNKKYKNGEELKITLTDGKYKLSKTDIKYKTIA